MSTAITTSIVINFKAEAGSILKAELDDRATSDGGFNGGDTNFAPGDNPTFLLYKTNDVTVTLRVTSDGVLQTLATPTIRKVEQLQFVNAKTAELAYPPIGGFAVLRASPGMPTGVLVGTNYTLPTHSVGIVEVEYLTQAEAIRVQGAAGDLPVVVYIEGTT